MESSGRGSKKDTGKYVAVSGQLCRYSCSILVYLYQCRSLKLVRCILSVGRQVFFPTNCDFLSAMKTSRVTTTTILVFSRSFTFL